MVFIENDNAGTTKAALKVQNDGTGPGLELTNAGPEGSRTGCTIFIQEQAEASTDKAGYGQIWVNLATPNELWFTDDAGTDTQLGVGGGTRGTFVDGDLSTGILTITHSEGLTTPFTKHITVADNSQKVILPDDVTFATDTIVVDLTSYGTLSGTWGYFYR